MLIFGNIMKFPCIFLYPWVGLTCVLFFFLPFCWSSECLYTQTCQIKSTMKFFNFPIFAFLGNWAVLWIEIQGILFAEGFQGSVQVLVCWVMWRCPVWSMAHGQLRAELSVQPHMRHLWKDRASRQSRAGWLLWPPLSCLHAIDINKACLGLWDRQSIQR